MGRREQDADPPKMEDLHRMRVPSGRFNGRGPLQVQILDGLLAHQELLDFACNGHREFIDEHDIAWNLVVSDLVPAEFANLLYAGLLAWLEADPGADLLAVFGIGHANDLDIADFGVTIKELLNLAGIDIFAPTDHHVLDAPDNVDIAILIHGRQVAGMHPARPIDSAGGSVWIVPVAEHHAIAACAEFAG